MCVLSQLLIFQILFEWIHIFLSIVTDFVLISEPEITLIYTWSRKFPALFRIMLTGKVKSSNGASMAEKLCTRHYFRSKFIPHFWYFGIFEKNGACYQRRELLRGIRDLPIFRVATFIGGFKIFFFNSIEYLIIS